MTDNIYTYPTVPQPVEMDINLYPHQLTSVYRMEELEGNERIEISEDKYIETTMGINADITGYGKSLSMVGLILRDKMSWDMNELYTKKRVSVRGGGKIIATSYERYERLNTNLVLCSQSLIPQWEKEFEHTNLRVATVIRSNTARDIDVHLFDVIIVSPTMYNILVFRYKNYVWKRFLYDEPTHLKVPRMQSVMSGFLWFITATPSSLLIHHRANNFIGEIFRCSYDIEYDFQYNIIKNDVSYIKSSVEITPPNHIYHECQQILYNTMKGIINDNVLNMISAGNISGAIKALGGTETTDVVSLICKKKQQELNHTNALLELYRHENNTRMVESYTKKQERLQFQLSQLEKRIEDMLTGLCCICYDTIQDPVLEEQCGNIFCGKCIFTCITHNNKCPMCRNVISPSQLIKISSTGTVSQQSSSSILKPKKQIILDIIQSKQEGKFIIFSEYDETFFQIHALLAENGITYAELKGQTTTRSRLIREFKSGDIKVILLNSNNNGAGINLQEATDIIMYHKMSENSQIQIIGRANRIGREGQLNVHHFI